MMQDGLILAAARVRSKKNKTKQNKTRKIHLTHRKHTTTNSQQPGDCDHLETACDETHPKRSPTHVRFHRSGVCGNRPRTALAISKNDE